MFSIKHDSRLKQLKEALYAYIYIYILGDVHTSNF